MRAIALTLLVTAAASSTLAIVAPRRGWRTTRAWTMPSAAMSWTKIGWPNT